MSDLIAFRGERVVAADKPAGWLSVPSRWGARDERRVLGRELETLCGARLWPVHRIDEEATGLVLFAFDADAHARLSAAFEHREVGKLYEALTEGDASAAPRGEQCWRSKILRGKKRAYESPAGKESETRATCEGACQAPDGEALAWRLEPVTGRPHQLRWELSHRGFPILGDALYGSRRPFADGAIALRCVTLGFDGDLAASLGMPKEVRVMSLRDWLRRGGSR